MRTKRITDNWLYNFKELSNLNRECWKYVLKRWWKLFFYILTAVATILTILSICKEIEIQKFTVVSIILSFLGIGVISFLTALPQNYSSYRIRGLHGTTIELIIGDMFDEKCDMVIPTNTCFDVGWNSIKKQSVQGQFCLKIYKDNPELLECHIDLELNKLNCERIFLEKKNIGRKIQYPLNTIITLQSGQEADAQCFHWIAINNSKENAEIEPKSICLHTSIDALWKHFATHRKIRDLCLPILGTGQAGINQPLPDIVEYYVDSFIIHSQSSNIVNTLKIYLYPNSENVFENYKYIANYLEYRSKNCVNIGFKYPKRSFR